VAFFSYQAVSAEGGLTEGVIEASEYTIAVERLKHSGVIPLQVTAEKEKRERRTFRFRRYDVLTFTAQLSALLNAGLPLDRCLEILVRVTEQRSMKGIIETLLKEIREGSTFSDALARHPQVFNGLYVSMARAGEAGGVLEVVLEKLNEFQESTKQLKGHLFSAMIYPAILLLTGCLSIAILLTFVLPRFSAIFSEMGRALPQPTVILIAVSDFLREYWWILLAFLIFAGLFFKQYARSVKGRRRIDYVKLKLLGDIIRKLETARFCRTLGTLLRSGVSLLHALSNAKDVMGNSVMGSAIDGVIQNAREGRGIGGPISAAQIFPLLAVSMIQVGEETGQLDVMLLKVASTYEESLRNSVKRFISLIEPLLILAMGLVIGFIVIAMLMAIFSITDFPV
jgi:general secretion pathway protein F